MTTPAPTTTVTLDTPIQRGETTITEVTLRKPRAGELRGVKLAELLQMDVATLRTVVPRISTPMLLAADIDAMDPADLLQIGTEVSGFLLTKATLASVSLTA
jgi:hypothetical protein